MVYYFIILYGSIGFGSVHKLTEGLNSVTNWGLAMVLMDPAALEGRLDQLHWMIFSIAWLFCWACNVKNHSNTEKKIHANHDDQANTLKPLEWVSSFPRAPFPHCPAAMAPSVDAHCPAPMATQMASSKAPLGGLMTSPSGRVRQSDGCLCKSGCLNGDVLVMGIHDGIDGMMLHIDVPIGSMYAIYGNIYHQYTPFMLAYIPAPWILWVLFHIVPILPQVTLK